MSTTEVIDLQGDIKPFFRDEHAILSEGISYTCENDTLYWIDIFRAEIHKLTSLNEADESKKTYTKYTLTPDNYDSSLHGVDYPYTKDDKYHESIGAIFPTEKGDIIYFGSKFGIGELNFQTSQWCYIVLYSQCKELQENDRFLRLRSNDANISPDGQYIFQGLMNDFMYPAQGFNGCVLKISVRDKTVELVWDDIDIPNAIHWNQSSDKIFITDSLRHCIWECPYDCKANEILDRANNKQKIIDIAANNPDFESPEPDGSAMEFTSGQFYVSVWSTAQVQVYNMVTGQLQGRILLPTTTPRVSCCCVVGSDLYITTANVHSDGSPETPETRDPYGGCIYKVKGVVPTKQRVSTKQYLTL